MISRWNFTQWPSHLSGARGGLLLFLPKLSDFSFADCSRAMFHKSTDYGKDMMVVQFLICFSLSCMHDFPIFQFSGLWFHCHVWKSIGRGKLLLISLMYTVFMATVNYW